jgi:hypothetical protein
MASFDILGHIARLEASQRKEIEWKVVRSIVRAGYPRLSVGRATPARA